MNYIVNAIIGNKKVQCVITAFPYSAISKNLLKKCNLEYKKLKNDKNNRIHLGGEKWFAPLGMAIIPITFKVGSNRLTIDSNINVVCKNNFPEWFRSDIILGYDWLMGRSLTDRELQIYRIEIIHDFSFGYLKQFLSIKGIGRSTHCKKCVIPLYFHENPKYSSDSESDISSDSSSDNSLSFVKIIPKKKMI